MQWEEPPRERWGHRDGITGYDLELDGVPMATNHPKPAYKFKDLEPSRDYVVSVVARNSLGPGVGSSIATIKFKTKSAAHQEL